VTRAVRAHPPHPSSREPRVAFCSDELRARILAEIDAVAAGA
jgi:hypothetical protein